MAPILATRGAGSALGFGRYASLGSSDWDSIATVYLSSTTSATISFTAIPTTYQNLQIRFTAKSSNSGSADMFFRINEDTTASNYWNTQTTRAETSAGNGTTNAYAGIGPIQLLGTSATNKMNSGLLNVFDYNNTNKHKTYSYIEHYDNAGSTTGSNLGKLAYIGSGTHNSTTSTTNITVYTTTGGFAQYSRFDLYGFKGAQ